MIFSKRTFVVVLASISSMAILACQPAFKMGELKPITNTVQTQGGPFTVSNVTAKVLNATGGTGHDGGIDLTFQISGDRVATRTVALKAGITPGYGNIPNQQNEPTMSYIAKCLNGDCSSMDVGIYFVFVPNTEVKVFAARVTGSKVDQTAFVAVDGNYVRADDPTTALTQSVSPVL